MVSSYIRNLGVVRVFIGTKTVCIARYVHFMGPDTSGQFNYGYAVVTNPNSLPDSLFLPGKAKHLGKTWMEVSAKLGLEAVPNPFADVVLDTAGENT